MVSPTPKDNVLLVVSQPRRFAAQKDKGIEGFGMLAWNLLEFHCEDGLDQHARNSPLQEEIIYTPPPPPISGQKAFFRGGGGVYILSPHAAGILYAPPFYTPPTPRRVFLGVGGWGCIKFGPVSTNGRRMGISLQPPRVREIPAPIKIKPPPPPKKPKIPPPP